LGKEIGSGRYGIVRLVAKKSYEKKRFAMKSIPREIINTDIHMLERELNILLKTDHPNIISFYEIYMDEQYFHFVT
jgi:serine/threonine protein kinase